MDTSEVQETLQAGDLDNEPHTNHYLVGKSLAVAKKTHKQGCRHTRALLWRSRQTVQVLVIMSDKQAAV